MVEAAEAEAGKNEVSERNSLRTRTYRVHDLCASIEETLMLFVEDTRLYRAIGWKKISIGVRYNQEKTISKFSISQMHPKY